MQKPDGQASNKSPGSGRLTGFKRFPPQLHLISHDSQQRSAGIFSD